MRECAKIKRLLNKYIDKELDKQGLDRIQGHVKECVFCKEELDKLYLVKGLIENRERKSLPEDYLVCRIKDRIRASLQQQPNLQWLIELGNLSKRLIPVPVVATAVLILTLFLTSNNSQTGNLLDNYLFQNNLTQREIDLLKDPQPNPESIAQWIQETNR